MNSFAGLKNTQDRYGSLIVALHWLMLLLIIAVYTCMELHEFFPKGSDTRAALKTWHFMLGLSVFALVLIRLAVRLSGPTPRIEPELPLWQRRVSRLMHLTLYAFMICMPLLGWLVLSAAGKSIPFFGFELPALIGESENLEELFEEIHEVIGTAGYFLIGLHSAAGLYHHYIVVDNTLRRILPGQ